MYVLEGSTLGANSSQRVLDLSNEMGYSYFRGYGAESGAMWKDFCTTLSHAAEDLDSAEGIASARQTFQPFRVLIVPDEAAEAGSELHRE